MRLKHRGEDKARERRENKQSRESTRGREGSLKEGEGDKDWGIEEKIKTEPVGWKSRAIKGEGKAAEAQEKQRADTGQERQGGTVDGKERRVKVKLET